MPKKPGFREIARDLRASVQRGDYLPGERLPEQERLASQYRVSRATVARAISSLVDEGVLDSAGRGGTWVLRPPIQLPIRRYSTVVDPQRPHRDLGPWETVCAEEGIPGRAELVSIERIPAPADVANRLGLPLGAELIRRNRRMWAGEQAVQSQTAWYPAVLVAGTPLELPDKIVGGVYAALATAGLLPAVADEEVAARLAGPTEVEALDVRERQPVLTLWRITRDRTGRPIEVVHIVAAAAAITLLYTNLSITHESLGGTRDPS